MQVRQHQRRFGIILTTARTTMVTAVLAPAVYEVHYKVVHFPYLVCADQTKTFPVQCRSGNNYLLALCG